jgi:glutathione synthase/RimK-type ligase-like ATP-grasp enzyme
MKKTLIVIGDPMMNQSRFEPSLKRFMVCSGMLLKRGIWFAFLTYDDVIKMRLPDLAAKRIEILLFFPYNYWNAFIERYDRDDRVYGDTSFGRDYESYLSRVGIILRRKYKDKHLKFINPPEACIVDRDKLKTYNMLRGSGIETPSIVGIKTLKQFYDALKKHGSLYIKPRFGAMGKGISYADRSGVYTNFIFKSDKVSSRMYDYNWRPYRIGKKNHNGFISLLISKGFIFQKAVNPLISKRRRFDIRVYTAFNKVPYMYAKSAPLNSFITNWSQGGRIEKKEFLENSLSLKEISEIKKMSLKAAGIIGLSFSGVDIIVDNDTRRLNVLEIQSFPGYEKGFDLMKFLAKNI